MNSNAPSQTKPSSAPPPTRADWSWPDLLDFEFFLQQDKTESAVLLEERDHQIFTGHLQPSLKSSPSPDRRWMFRQWLEARRNTFDNPESLPGNLAWNTWNILLKSLVVLGLLAGAGLAANLLQYDGRQPVNVAAYLGWLVIIQIAMVLLAGLVVLLRRTHLFKSEFSIFSGLLRWIWSWLSTRISHAALTQVNADQRTRIQSFLGSLSAHQSIYSRVTLWPTVCALQRFGVYFNGGALIATLTLVMFSDRAFGWQSALNVSPQQIHQLVQTLATPWSWALPEAAGPTLAQIEGSKIILKDGIKQLTTQNLVSWWPFLCLALATYGLLPRLLLWILTAWLGRRSLDKLRFNQVACDRLLERLLGAQLQTSGLGSEPQRKDLPLEAPHSPTPKTGSVSSPLPSTMALVPQDLLPDLDQAAFLDLMRSRFHWNLTQDQIHAWPNDSPSRDTLLAQLSAPTSPENPPRLVLLEEAWQPPIAEKLSTLRDLRQTLGPAATILLGLVGRPQNHHILTPVHPSNWTVWERQINSLGDPQLRLEDLGRRSDLSDLSDQSD